MASGRSSGSRGVRWRPRFRLAATASPKQRVAAAAMAARATLRDGAPGQNTTLSRVVMSFIKAARKSIRSWHGNDATSCRGLQRFEGRSRSLAYARRGASIYINLTTGTYPRHSGTPLRFDMARGYDHNFDGADRTAKNGSHRDSDTHWDRYAGPPTRSFAHASRPDLRAAQSI